jgi:hypothetical protein
VNRPALACLALAALALAAGPSASSTSTQLVSLGPVVVANGIASFTGTVGSSAAGLSLTANGQPVTVSANGAFAGTVNLNGASTLDLALSGPAGSDWTGFSIPLTGALVGPGGVIPPGALDQVEQAGIALAAPLVGSDGLKVSGSVADGSQLSGLSLNGADVLGQATRDHTFTVQVPGTTLGLVLAASDKNGVTESVHRQLTVDAVHADGVKIVSVRFWKRNVRRNGRLRMVVRVRDRQGRMIRGARVIVRASKRGFLAKRPHTKHTGTRGGSTLTLRVRKSALGKRLVVLTVAKTPRAKARKKSAVKLPAGRRHS